jgi:hypothetical protein
MNTTILTVLFCMVIAIALVLACAWLHKNRKGLLAGTHLMANVGEGVHEEGIWIKSAAAITTRNLLYKRGADDDHVVVVAAQTDLPMGTINDEATAAEEVVTLLLLGSGARSTRKFVANGALTKGALLYTAAAGKVQGTPAGASGVAHLVGQALSSTTADGDIIEAQACTPIKFTF